MHYGEIEHRSIYGEASPEEAKDLHDEGIEFHPLPVLAGRTELNSTRSDTFPLSAHLNCGHRATCAREFLPSGIKSAIGHIEVAFDRQARAFSNNQGQFWMQARAFAVAFSSLSYSSQVALKLSLESHRSTATATDMPAEDRQRRTHELLRRD